METKQEIEGRIKGILVDQLQVDPNLVAESTPTTRLFGRGIGLDSVEALALATQLEITFDIQIDDEDLTVRLFRNIETLAEYVLEKRSGHAALE
jgi:acyl carrier protein